MPRYILIDANSGYIFGDTADLNSRIVECATVIDAARAIDESLQQHGRNYTEVNSFDGRSGYAVYRADINGSEAVGVVHDGQDQETIDAVVSDCQFEGNVVFNDGSAE